MREVMTGVWCWEAPHPDWVGPENQALRERLAAMSETPNESARGVVSSYAIQDDERLLLFDPLGVPTKRVSQTPERNEDPLTGRRLDGTIQDQQSQEYP